jgi:hypothetical protein
LEHFKQFDDCPTELRQRVAVMIDHTIQASKMSVVDFIIDNR